MSTPCVGSLPSKAPSRHSLDGHPPMPHDRPAYRQRNLIERMFCRLKAFRRVATRYHKLARNYAAAVRRYRRTLAQLSPP